VVVVERGHQWHRLQVRALQKLARYHGQKVEITVWSCRHGTGLRDGVLYQHQSFETLQTLRPNCPNTWYLGDTLFPWRGAWEAPTPESIEVVPLGASRDANNTALETAAQSTRSWLRFDLEEPERRGVGAGYIQALDWLMSLFPVPAQAVHHNWFGQAQRGF